MRCVALHCVFRSFRIIRRPSVCTSECTAAAVAPRRRDARRDAARACTIFCARARSDRLATRYIGNSLDATRRGEARSTCESLRIANLRARARAHAHTHTPYNSQTHTDTHNAKANRRENTHAHTGSFSSELTAPHRTARLFSTLLFSDSFRASRIELAADKSGSCE